MYKKRQHNVCRQLQFRKGKVTCMKQIKKAISAFLATALLAAMLPGTALAESRTKIGKVNLEVHSRIRIGDSSEDVTVTCLLYTSKKSHIPIIRFFYSLCKLVNMKRY